MDVNGAVHFAIMTRDMPPKGSTILYLFWLELNGKRDRLRHNFFRYSFITTSLTTQR